MSETIPTVRSYRIDLVADERPGVTRSRSIPLEVMLAEFPPGFREAVCGLTWWTAGDTDGSKRCDLGQVRVTVWRRGIFCIRVPNPRTREFGPVAVGELNDWWPDGNGRPDGFTGPGGAFALAACAAMWSFVWLVTAHLPGLRKSGRIGDELADELDRGLVRLLERLAAAGIPSAGAMLDGLKALREAPAAPSARGSEPPSSEDAGRQWGAGSRAGVQLAAALTESYAAQLAGDGCPTVARLFVEHAKLLRGLAGDRPRCLRSGCRLDVHGPDVDHVDGSGWRFVDKPPLGVPAAE